MLTRFCETLHDRFEEVLHVTATEDELVGEVKTEDNLYLTITTKR